ncbi:hypothetical protein JZ751_011145 [Albula glossodonta]|uniref:Uncharacterized protein n=1 Tax=Albula glossodonta TaxID=121402 RepID=A0A8T2NVV1_9TELE|nr:hypothetical protein JZ751_011145 [Albula glossodonta]
MSGIVKGGGAWCGVGGVRVGDCQNGYWDFAAVTVREVLNHPARSHCADYATSTVRLWSSRAGRGYWRPTSLVTAAESSGVVLHGSLSIWREPATRPDEEGIVGRNRPCRPGTQKWRRSEVSKLEDTSKERLRFPVSPSSCLAGSCYWVSLSKMVSTQAVPVCCICNRSGLPCQKTDCDVKAPFDRGNDELSNNNNSSLQKPMVALGDQTVMKCQLRGGDTHSLSHDAVVMASASVTGQWLWCEKRRAGSGEEEGCHSTRPLSLLVRTAEESKRSAADGSHCREPGAVVSVYLAHRTASCHHVPLITWVSATCKSLAYSPGTLFKWLLLLERNGAEREREEYGGTSHQQKTQASVEAAPGAAGKEQPGKR